MSPDSGPRRPQDRSIIGAVTRHFREDPNREMVQRVEREVAEQRAKAKAARQKGKGKR